MASFYVEGIAREKFRSRNRLVLWPVVDTSANDLLFFFHSNISVPGYHKKTIASPRKPDQQNQACDNNKG